MSLRDNNFLSFVKEEAGEAAAALFEIQGINCLKSLLMTANVYSIMEIKSVNLAEFKNKYGYLQDDNTYIIQPGFRGNVDYLLDVLKKKILNDAKLSKFSKHGQSLSSANKTTDTLLTTTNSTSSISLEISSRIITSTPLNPSTANEQKEYIIQIVKTWCEKNKSDFNLPEFSLIEGKHYFVVTQVDSNGSLKGYIRCSCGKCLSLPIRRHRFQLSNFYRHLQDFRNGNICPMMKKRIGDILSNPTSSTNNQDTLSSPSDLSQYASSPDLTAITPAYVTSPATHSILPTMDDDDNINIHKKSSSIESQTQLKRKADVIEYSYNTREAARKKRR